MNPRFGLMLLVALASVACDSVVAYPITSDSGEPPDAGDAGDAGDAKGPDASDGSAAAD